MARRKKSKAPTTDESTRTVAVKVRRKSGSVAVKRTRKTTPK